MLIHVEIQGQVDPTLSERVFVYGYRIRDRYGPPIVSLVVLADDRPDWHPRAFEEELLGCRTVRTFLTAKLLEWEARDDELAADPNPIAVVVRAHLASLRTRKDPHARLDWSFRLIRGLFERGCSREEILELIRLIDWLLKLPAELEQELWRRVERLEEEFRVVYRLSFERVAEERGREEGRKEGEALGFRREIVRTVARRFGAVPPELTTRLEGIQDLELLDSLADRAAAVAHPDELLASLPRSSEASS